MDRVTFVHKLFKRILLPCIRWPPLILMYQADKCVVAQVLKVVVIINLIIIDHSRMIQAFRFIEISKYDDGNQLTTRGQRMQGSSI